MAIIPHKTPKITKLDGRYKLYNRGFRYKVSFDAMKNYDSYYEAVRWCENTWVPEYTHFVDDSLFIRHILNSNWRASIRTTDGKNKWRREIYLCREEDVTMMLLVAGG